MSVQKLNRRRGKELERYVAKRFAGKRLSVLGGEDIALRTISIECKERRSFKTLRAWVTQANSYSGNRVPIVYYHEHNTPHTVDLMILYVNNFEHILKFYEKNYKGTKTDVV